LKKKLISVVTACYNEEENVEALCLAVREIFKGLPQYDHEHIFIDNCSTDRTVAILKGVARKDKRVKIIVNARNFGHIRSPYHAIIQAKGEAVISLVADFQDPPELMLEFLKRWEAGSRIVVGVKEKSKESALFFLVRKAYYRLVTSLADIELIQNFTGFGLYDRRVIEVLRSLDDPYPYFRGLISDIGFKPSLVPYVQPLRRGGVTKNNLFTLYDLAMLGITSHSRTPLRLAGLLGFGMAGLSLLAALTYLVYKLLFWHQFELGMAPLVIGFFLISSVQLIFIGMLGEYMGNIQTQVLKRPRVVEEERVNF
jgi:glycosyltransferase involved in cell wall biosynthesis